MSIYNFATLPYAYNALEPVIDEATMKLHKDRHHKTYFDKFVAEIEKTDFNGKDLAEIFKNISKLSPAIRNNGGGFYNHDLFFNAMRPAQEDNQPTGELMAKIKEDFGSFEEFKNLFSAAAVNQFGSGWAWLSVNKEGKLQVSSTANQDNPLMDIASVQGKPILGLDVWEHAYYLNYQNKRPDYVSAWWKVVNWDYVEKLWKES